MSGYRGPWRDGTRNRPWNRSNRGRGYITSDNQFYDPTMAYNNQLQYGQYRYQSRIWSRGGRGIEPPWRGSQNIPRPRMPDLRNFETYTHFQPPPLLKMPMRPHYTEPPRASPPICCPQSSSPHPRIVDTPPQALQPPPKLITETKAPDSLPKKLDKNKIFQLINSTTKYEPAMQKLLREQRMQSTRELRSMYNEMPSVANNLFEDHDPQIPSDTLNRLNSLIPDIGVDIEFLPPELVAQLNIALEGQIKDDFETGDTIHRQANADEIQPEVKENIGHINLSPSGFEYFEESSDHKPQITPPCHEYYDSGNSNQEQPPTKDSFPATSTSSEVQTTNNTNHAQPLQPPPIPPFLDDYTVLNSDANIPPANETGEICEGSMNILSMELPSNLDDLHLPSDQSSFFNFTEIVNSPSNESLDTTRKPFNVVTVDQSEDGLLDISPIRMEDPDQIFSDDMPTMVGSKTCRVADNELHRNGDSCEFKQRDFGVFMREYSYTHEQTAKEDFIKDVVVENFETNSSYEEIKLPELVQQTFETSNPERRTKVQLEEEINDEIFNTNDTEYENPSSVRSCRSDTQSTTGFNTAEEMRKSIEVMIPEDGSVATRLTSADSNVISSAGDGVAKTEIDGDVKMTLEETTSDIWTNNSVGDSKNSTSSTKAEIDMSNGIEKNPFIGSSTPELRIIPESPRGEENKETTNDCKHIEISVENTNLVEKDVLEVSTAIKDSLENTIQISRETEKSANMKVELKNSKSRKSSNDNCNAEQIESIPKVVSKVVAVMNNRTTGINKDLNLNPLLKREKRNVLVDGSESKVRDDVRRRHDENTTSKRNKRFNFDSRFTYCKLRANRAQCRTSKLYYSENPLDRHSKKSNKSHKHDRHSRKSRTSSSSMRSRSPSSTASSERSFKLHSKSVLRKITVTSRTKNRKSSPSASRRAKNMLIEPDMEVSRHLSQSERESQRATNRRVIVPSRDKRIVVHSPGPANIQRPRWKSFENSLSAKLELLPPTETITLSSDESHTNKHSHNKSKSRKRRDTKSGVKAKKKRQKYPRKRKSSTETTTSLKSRLDGYRRTLTREIKQTAGHLAVIRTGSASAALHRSYCESGTTSEAVDIAEQNILEVKPEVDDPLYVTTVSTSTEKGGGDTSPLLVPVSQNSPGGQVDLHIASREFNQAGNEHLDKFHPVNDDTNLFINSEQKSSSPEWTLKDPFQHTEAQSKSGGGNELTSNSPSLFEVPQLTSISLCDSKIPAADPPSDTMSSGDFLQPQSHPLETEESNDSVSSQLTPSTIAAINTLQRAGLRIQIDTTTSISSATTPLPASSDSPKLTNIQKFNSTETIPTACDMHILRDMERCKSADCADTTPTSKFASTSTLSGTAPDVSAPPPESFQSLNRRTWRSPGEKKFICENDAVRVQSTHVEPPSHVKPKVQDGQKPSRERSDRRHGHGKRSHHASGEKRSTSQHDHHKGKHDSHSSTRSSRAPENTASTTPSILDPAELEKREFIVPKTRDEVLRKLVELDMAIQNMMNQKLILYRMLDSFDPDKPTISSIIDTMQTDGRPPTRTVHDSQGEMGSGGTRNRRGTSRKSETTSKDKKAPTTKDTERSASTSRKKSSRENSTESSRKRKIAEDAGSLKRSKRTAPLTYSGESSENDELLAGKTHATKNLTHSLNKIKSDKHMRSTKRRSTIDGGEGEGEEAISASKKRSTSNRKINLKIPDQKTSNSKLIPPDQLKIIATATEEKVSCNENVPITNRLSSSDSHTSDSGFSGFQTSSLVESSLAADVLQKVMDDSFSDGTTPPVPAEDTAERKGEPLKENIEPPSQRRVRTKKTIKSGADQQPIIATRLRSKSITCDDPPQVVDESIHVAVPAPIPASAPLPAPGVSKGRVKSRRNVTRETTPVSEGTLRKRRQSAEFVMEAIDSVVGEIQKNLHESDRSAAGELTDIWEDSGRKKGKRSGEERRRRQAVRGPTESIKGQREAEVSQPEQPVMHFENSVTSEESDFGKGHRRVRTTRQTSSVAPIDPVNSALCIKECTVFIVPLELMKKGSKVGKSTTVVDGKSNLEVIANSMNDLDATTGVGSLINEEPAERKVKRVKKFSRWNHVRSIGPENEATDSKYRTRKNSQQMDGDVLQPRLVPLKLTRSRKVSAGLKTDSPESANIVEQYEVVKPPEEIEICSTDGDVSEAVNTCNNSQIDAHKLREEPTTNIKSEPSHIMENIETRLTPEPVEDVKQEEVTIENHDLSTDCNQRLEVSEKLEIKDDSELNPDIHILSKMQQKTGEEKTPSGEPISCRDHKGSILCVKTAGNVLIAACEDGNLYKYDLRNGTLLASGSGHKQPITSLVIVTDNAKNENIGATVYSGALDSTLRCFDVDTMKYLAPLTRTESPIQCLDEAWGYIFIGTNSGHLYRYSIQMDKLSDDKRQLAETSLLSLKATREGGRRVLLVAPRNELVSIRDAMTGLLLRYVSSGTHTIYSLLLSDSLIYCGTNQNVILGYDFTNGNVKTELSAGKGVVCLLIHKKLLFAGCYDGQVYVFNTRNMEPVKTLPGPGGMILALEVTDHQIVIGCKNSTLQIFPMPSEIKAVADTD